MWSIDIDDISASHLHPADLGGTIVSIDRPLPPESWRWGGPDWIGHAGEGAPGRLAGVTVRVTDPEPVAVRWAAVLGLEPDGTTLRLDRDQHGTFEHGDEGLTEIAVQLPGKASRPLAFGAARIVRDLGTKRPRPARHAVGLRPARLPQAAPPHSPSSSKAEAHKIRLFADGDAAVKLRTVRV